MLIFAKKLFDGFLVFHHGVEEYLEVDFAVITVGIERYADTTARYHLAVECVGNNSHSIVEIEFLGDFAERGLQQHLVIVENDDGVDEVLHVFHLVGGDDDGAFLVGVFGDYLSEEGLGWDVETVGGLVEKQIVGVECQSGGNQAFFLLTE